MIILHALFLLIIYLLTTMKKLKNFLNSFEEDYLFRFGKRSWQAISLIFLGFLVYAIVLYLWNTTPSFREDVSISKIEFDRNRIDRDFDISNDIEQSTLADYNKALDSLKKAMPESEWIKLGDSITKTEYEYQERQMYNPWYGGYYTDYVRVPYTYRVFQKNREAVPNILEDIYEEKAIDSAQYTDKIKVLRMAQVLISFSDKKEATTLLRDYFKGFLVYTGELDHNKVKSIAKLYEKADRRPKFKNPYGENDDWDQFSAYLRVGREDSLTEERFKITENTVSKLKSKAKFKEKDQVHAVARITLGSDLTDEDLTTATEEFFSSKDFKITDKNAREVYGKYHYLFLEKAQLADQMLEEKQLEKEINRSSYYYEARVAFLAIIMIAAVLILFSIRSIIKNKQNA
jgi:hypothetical protein